MSRIKNPVWKCWSQPQIIVIPCGGLHVYNRTSTFPDYILILPDGILDAFEIRRNRTMNGCFVLCTENGDIYDIKGSYMFILGYVKDNYLSPNEKRKPKRVKWVYDHLGRLWMSFRCRSDVVSDVVQIAGGIQKFDILLCDRSKHSDTSGRTGLWKLKMAHVGWKWKTKQNRMWFSQTPIYVYVWFGCRFRCRSRCRSPPKWTTLKTV